MSPLAVVIQEDGLDDQREPVRQVQERLYGRTVVQVMPALKSDTGTAGRLASYAQRYERVLYVADPSWVGCVEDALGMFRSHGVEYPGTIEFRTIAGAADVEAIATAIGEMYGKD